MSNKVVMVLIDGMRPDAMLSCSHPFLQQLLEKSSYDLQARTVFPPVTLPCHFSLFHSVPPTRHGVITNLYTPQVRPIRGIFDRLGKEKKKCAFFHSWEQLRDLSRPGRLHCSYMININREKDVDRKLTDAAVEYIQKEAPDFTFLYLGETDEHGGHQYGWMSEEYLGYIRNAIDCVQRVDKILNDADTLILLADHGGHDRSHGVDCEEDMTIPVILKGPDFTPGSTLKNVSILDIAPTVSKLLGTEKEEEWEGKELF